jgi:transcription elongation factor GreB
MSKAFLRETDLPDLPDFSPPTPLPSGAKNYLTPGGVQTLRAELNRLVQHDRPAVAAQPHDAEQKRELRLLDQRIRYLEESLRTAEVIRPSDTPPDRVRFGTSVSVREPSGVESTYRIVGVDETDVTRGWVSWVSPIARALMSGQVGDRVTFASPAGERTLEITSIFYDAAEDTEVA